MSFPIRKQIAVLLLLSAFCQAQSVDLPPSHWINGFMNRMVTRQLIEAGTVAQGPVSRMDAAELLLHVYSSWKQQPSLLSKAESDILMRALAELSDDLPASSEVKQLYRREPHLFRYRTAGRSLFIDAGAGGSILRNLDSSDDNAFTRAWYGGILRFKAGGLSAYSDNRIFGERGNGPYYDEYDLSLGYPRNGSKDSLMATWDESVSYIRLNKEWLTVTYGRGPIVWGPSRYGSLAVSGLKPFFDHIHLSAQLGNIKYDYFHADLQHATVRKWMAGHRLLINLREKGHVAFHETVIYADRGLEMAYLNPVLPFLISEHTLGDHDNVSMGMDASWCVRPGFRLYGELFIDDLVAPWTLFEDKWSNKKAIILGLHYIDFAGIGDTELTLEYHRIDPYVYTHRFENNVYEHYNSGLGSSLEPNSDFFFLEFKKFWHHGIAGGIRLNRVRHGRGSRRLPHDISDGDKKNFLEGPLDQSLSASLFADLELKRDIYLNFELGYGEQNQALSQSGKWDKIIGNIGMECNW